MAKVIKMDTQGPIYIVEVLLVSLLTSPALCSIDGKTYMDDLNFGPYKRYATGDDPCNPLYWYPREIPDYCYRRSVPVSPADQPTPSTPCPEPAPSPVMPPRMPLPPCPLPMQPMPPPPMYPVPLPYPYPQCSPYPYGPPGMPLPPTPYMPQPMPFPANPYYPGEYLPAPGYYRPPGLAGFVPGLPGLVSRDGGINILPFSDAYAEMLEKHKQKLIRLRLQGLLDKYDGRGRRGRRRRRIRRKNIFEE